jgi:hypothetical protein
MLSLRVRGYCTLFDNVTCLWIPAFAGMTLEYVVAEMAPMALIRTAIQNGIIDMPSISQAPIPTI